MLTLPAVLAALCGCSAQAPEGGDDSVGTATEAFDNTCTQSGADVTWTSTGNTTWSPPYGKYCYKALVVDVDNLEVTNPGSSNAGILMQWADTVPTDQATCQAAWVGAYLFNWNGSSWVWNGQGPINGYGQWINFFGSSYCSPPQVLFSTSVMGAYGLSDGGTYRVEVTARASNLSGAALKAVNVSTQNGIN